MPRTTWKTSISFGTSKPKRWSGESLSWTTRSCRLSRMRTAFRRCSAAPAAAVQADFWIDCSGFSSFLLGKTLHVPFVSFKRSLFCDRAVVGGWERGPDEVIKPYTTAETMDSGWCWQIDHDHRVNRGYVYSSAFISDAEAEGEFRRKNPKVGPTRVVRFVSGYYERAWEKNVVAIGNSAGFVEPLESTALMVICDESWMLARSLAEADLSPGKAIADVYNKWCRQNWESIRGFLALHFRFNKRLETPFWRRLPAGNRLGRYGPGIRFVFSGKRPFSPVDGHARPGTRRIRIGRMGYDACRSRRSLPAEIHARRG